MMTRAGQRLSAVFPGLTVEIVKPSEPVGVATSSGRVVNVAPAVLRFWEKTALPLTPVTAIRWRPGLTGRIVSKIT